MLEMWQVQCFTGALRQAAMDSTETKKKIKNARFTSEIQTFCTDRIGDRDRAEGPENQGQLGQPELQ